MVDITIDLPILLDNRTQVLLAKEIIDNTYKIKAKEIELLC